jgi:hypothetical protein
MSATLETLLLRDGILNPEQVVTAVDDARRTHQTLAETVIDLGFVEERRLAEWIAEVSGTQLVDPLPEDVAMQLERRLAPATARLRMVVPVGEESGALYVAMVNPLDEATIQVLKATSGSEIVARTGVRSAIERLVNRVYPEQLDGDATVLPSVRFTFEPQEPRAAAPSPPTPAEPASTPSPVPADEEPFDFSTRTLLSSRQNLQELNDEFPAAPDERFGTLVAQPLPASALEPLGTEPPRAEPPAQDGLARIEQRLDTIAGAIERVQKRLDALDMTLMRFMNR